VDGLAGGRTALVLVVHHVLTDGLGALAVLDRLTDGAGGVAMPPARPRPAARSLAMDAWRSRLGALAMTRQRLRQLRTAMAAGGGISPVRAQPCSLLTVTGPRRRVAAVHAPLSALHDATHRHDATVNSALLTAVAEALRQLLERRAETISTVTVAVPAGTPRAAGVTAGNAVAPLVVPVPLAGPWDRRLRQVAAEVRRHRAGAAGPAPITVLGGAFRMLAALGGYRWYMTHQRRMHTLVSYVRGPAATVRFGGATVLEMIPISVGGESNIPVTFLALSYAGSLVLTAVADPDACPELDLLAKALQADLDAIGTNGTGTCGDGGLE